MKDMAGVTTCLFQGDYLGAFALCWLEGRDVPGSTGWKEQTPLLKKGRLKPSGA